MWIAASGSVDEGVLLYEADLPACCQRTAGSFDEHFGCPACGAVWDAAQLVEAEGDAFMAPGVEERKGAA
jgi:hypothetical protein